MSTPVVYVVERHWDYEGSDVVGVTAALARAKRLVREHAEEPKIEITRSSRDHNGWTAVPKRGIADRMSILRTEVLQ